MGYDGYGSGLGAFFAIYLVVLLIVGAVSYVLGSFLMMKVFDKAGITDRWRAWVPVYNTMIFFKLGDLSPWLVLYATAGTLLLAWIGIGVLFAIALQVFAILAAWRIGLKLQKDSVWILLYIFIPVVWLGIVGFDGSRWNRNIAPASWAGNGFLGDRTVWAGIPAQSPAGFAAPGYGAPQGYAQPGYAQPGYGAPQGYTQPAQPGYSAPVPQGYGAPVPPAQPYGQPVPPAQPGYGAPVPPAQPYGQPAPQSPAVPPAAPQPPATASSAPESPFAPPAQPTAPPTAPPAPPAVPPVPPVATPAPPAVPPVPPVAPPADPAQPPA